MFVKGENLYMKIVNVGDILISPEAMARATANFDCYDEVKNFYFGPRDKEEFRIPAWNPNPAIPRLMSSSAVWVSTTVPSITNTISRTPAPM